MQEEHPDDLLKRALIDAEAAASVALRVSPLALSETLTVDSTTSTGAIEFHLEPSVTH